MPRAIVGRQIIPQLVGVNGPVTLGELDEYETTPNPKVNERELLSGATESEVTGMGPWTIRLKRGKRDDLIDQLFDQASDPLTAPSLQFVETISYNDGRVVQYLYSGITLRGGGVTAAPAVDESLELAADKRQRVG